MEDSVSYRYEENDEDYVYELLKNGKVVYRMDGSYTGSSSFEKLKIHTNFMDIYVNYKETGKLPTRFQKGVLRKL